MIFQHYYELLRIYRAQIAGLVLFTTAIFGAVSYMQLRTSPQYSAAASVIMMPSEAELAFAQNQTTAGRAARTLTETYIEYVKSRPVVEAAIDRVAQLRAEQVAEAGAEPEAEAAILPEPVDGLEALVERSKTQLRDLRRRLVEFDRGAYVTLPEREREIARIQGAISVSNIVNTHILRIEVTLSDPDEAALMANTLAEAYVERVSEQIDVDANRLEGYLQGEIAKKESQLERLRAEQTTLIERFGPVQGTAGGIVDQMRVAEAQLAELNSRLLTVNLSRASSETQVRMIEPAMAPVYPASPRVLRTTLIGFWVGLVLAIGSTVIRDSLSEKIKTTTDLRRIVGIQGLGLLRRKWVSRKRKRPLKRLGREFGRHFAASGLHEHKQLPKPKPLPELPRPSTDTAEGVDTHEVEADIGAIAGISRSETVMEAVRQLKRARDASQGHESKEGASAPPKFVVQVTGFVPMETLCWATIGISAAIASGGDKVYCKLPEGQPKRRPQMRFRNTGELAYELDGTDASMNAYLTIECVGPMNVERDVVVQDQTGPVICVLPQDEISEQVIESMQKRLKGHGALDHVYFVLMAN